MNSSEAPSDVVPAKSRWIRTKCALSYGGSEFTQGDFSDLWGSPAPRGTAPQKQLVGRAVPDGGHGPPYNSLWIRTDPIPVQGRQQKFAQ